ncbi:MAG: SulP family inorganic anion transporter [Bacteroidota bacterium]
MSKFIKNWRVDLPASLVVFLVALPLCLGIALASTGNEPRLFSGIIAGVIGGVVVGFLSGSRIGVSGPAAGLITIVISAIATLGSFEAFLLAVVLAGVIQVFAGFMKAGVIGNYFPSSVIKGMLAAIGLTLILKEIPHAFGYDADFMGDESFFQVDGHNTFSEILIALNKISVGAIIITICSIATLILFETKAIKRFAVFKILPGALFVVLLGIGLNLLFKFNFPDLYMDSKHLVTLPQATNWTEFTAFFTFPDFSAFKNVNVYVVALTIALVGSIETLLSVEATDKLDPEKHHTSRNRELKAQGVGNILSGMLGGLPITQVVVRSSANINAGGKSKMSAILHGVLLFACVLLIPNLLNLIPLASLASILLILGYKLAKISLFKKMYAQGLDQFLPFVATIIAILFTDLLKGIGIGILFAIITAIYNKAQKFDSYKDAILHYILFFIKRDYKNNIRIHHHEKEAITIHFTGKITFINKAKFIKTLDNLPHKIELTFDGSKSSKIDFEILEVIQDYKHHGRKSKEIEVKTIDIDEVEVSNH